MCDVTEIKRLLGGKRLVLASNREPYIHKKRTDGNIVCVRGSGGLVAALDPVLQSTGGLWVAWGSGNVDFTISDYRGRVKVPPKNLLTRLGGLDFRAGMSPGIITAFPTELCGPSSASSSIRRIL